MQVFTFYSVAIVFCYFFLFRLYASDTLLVVRQSCLILYLLCFYVSGTHFIVWQSYFIFSLMFIFQLYTFSRMPIMLFFIFSSVFMPVVNVLL